MVVLCQCLFMNHIKIRENTKKLLSCHPKKYTTIYLTVTSTSDPITVDNTNDELVVTRAPIETDKPLYQPNTANLSYSN